jgi:hypothetical protein
MSEELDHVLRPSLPWRSEHLTECGRDPNGLNVLTNEDFIARCKKLGKQRTAMITCMTCLQTTENWLHSQGSLTARLGREVDRVGRKWSRESKDGGRLENELRAIEFLVQAHRDEFDDALEAMQGAVSLDRARSAKRAKQRYS